MYAKIFAQILDSSIAEDYQCRHLFMDLLVLADERGVVDMTMDAISRRTNVPIEIVTKSIEKLIKPDPNSRNQEEEGRRLVPLADNRLWGWRIVSYRTYREIHDRDELRESNRIRKQRQRDLFEDVESSHVESRLGCDSNVTRCDKVGKYASASASGLSEEEVKEKERQKILTDLEEIYQLYPRKASKHEALKAILKAMNRVGKPFLLERTKLFADAWNGEALRFCPYPSTWFNQKRYEDDPSTWLQISGKPKTQQQYNAI